MTAQIVKKNDEKHIICLLGLRVSYLHGIPMEVDFNHHGYSHGFPGICPVHTAAYLLDGLFNSSLMHTLYVRDRPFDGDGGYGNMLIWGKSPVV